MKVLVFNFICLKLSSSTITCLWNNGRNCTLTTNVLISATVSFTWGKESFRLMTFMPSTPKSSGKRSRTLSTEICIPVCLEA